MFDMNNLKQINDSLGHAAGDSAIQNFARMLRLSVPEHYFVGRFGGDEFLVILHHADASLLDTIIASLQGMSRILCKFPRNLCHIFPSMGPAVHR